MKLAWQWAGVVSLPPSLLPSPFAGIRPPLGSSRNISPGGRDAGSRLSGTGGTDRLSSAGSPNTAAGSTPLASGMTTANSVPTGTGVVLRKPTKTAMMAAMSAIG